MTSNLVEHNPRLKRPVACVLATMQELESQVCAGGACAARGTREADSAREAHDAREAHAGIDREQLEALLDERWEPSFAQIPATVIDVLVRNGALVQQLFVDGEPYAGTLSDMQFDDSIEPGAQVTALVSATQEGNDLLASLDPAATLRKLLEERPHYAGVFKRMVACCVNAAEGDASDGAVRTQLEQAIEQDGPVHAPDGRRVYPQYFIDALEGAGGIEWHGAWCATVAGRAWCAECAESAERAASAGHASASGRAAAAGHASLI